MEHVYTLDTTGKIKNTKMDRVEKSNCDTTWGSQILAQEVVNCKESNINGYNSQLLGQEFALLTIHNFLGKNLTAPCCITIAFFYTSHFRVLYFTSGVQGINVKEMACRSNSCPRSCEL
ncbi:hypothetical protein QL285_090557 [Trifolium repens]|nr:hypothetical protein QL285_090557 [Trifolium repens]